MQPTYKPGDVVFIVTHRNVPTRRTTITAVKDYKRGTKVTTYDGVEWDASSGLPWKARAETWYSGATLAPYTDELAAAFTSRKREAALRWCLEHWTELPADTQKMLGRMAADIRAHREKPA